ncbi:MAG: tetratricopeptide (TPR) repeat protein [Chlamydiales bacterium]|jgi:tetratricopeptide (TPR) repeat protein
MKRKTKVKGFIKAKVLENIDWDFLSKESKSLHPLMHTLGITSARLEHLYELSLGLLEKRDYDRAADAFFFLVTLNTDMSELWLRLGNAEQGRREYEQAIEAYYFAYLNDADDPYPMLYSAQCYESLEEYETGMKCLVTAREVIQDNQDGVIDYKEIENQIEIYSQNLRAKSKKGK